MNEPATDEASSGLSSTFLVGSDDELSRIEPPRRMREQATASRRRYARRRMQVVIAASVAVAAVGVTAALLSGSRRDSPSPYALVTDAIMQTSADSYSFILDSTARVAGRQISSDIVSGAIDQRHELGAELVTAHSVRRSARVEIRFIGKYVYAWASPGSGIGNIGKPWDKAMVPPPGAAVLPEGDFYGFSTEQLVSPAELLGVLSPAANVQDSGSASGPGWTGARYAFAERLSPRESISGTVYIDQRGRVRRIVTITIQGWAVMARDLSVSDFGSPVSVSAPLATQVKYTSGKPYWGLFF